MGVSKGRMGRTGGVPQSCVFNELGRNHTTPKTSAGNPPKTNDTEKTCLSSGLVPGFPFNFSVEQASEAGRSHPRPVQLERSISFDPYRC